MVKHPTYIAYRYLFCAAFLPIILLVVILKCLNYKGL